MHWGHAALTIVCVTAVYALSLIGQGFIRYFTAKSVIAVEPIFDSTPLLQ